MRYDSHRTHFPAVDIIEAGAPVMHVTCDVHGPILDTDDGVVAETALSDHRRFADVDQPYDDGRVYLLARIVGTHDTHVWSGDEPDAACAGCEMTNNGCFGSHFPCGFVFEPGAVLSDYIDRARNLAEVGRTLDWLERELRA